MKDLRSAKALRGVAINAHYVRSSRNSNPILLSTDQIKHIQSKDPEGVASLGQSKPGGMDNLYAFLETSGFYYVSLLQRVDLTDSGHRSTKLFNETVLERTVAKSDLELESTQMDTALTVANQHRNARSLNDDQEMMVAVAYVTPDELRQFQLFHSVLHIDATADTNKEGRPLVTVSSKDSNGKMFIVMRSYLPNEQAWVYQWLFQTVFPALLGNSYLNDVKMIMTDGDFQEISQLEAAISNHFPRVFRARCAWHIIDRGWNAKVKFALGGHSKRKRPSHLRCKPRKPAAPLTRANRIARLIYRWMFSWAQPGHCITEEEYMVSKALFLSFVAGTVVLDALGETARDVIFNFVNGHVFTQENHFTYYRRHHIFHLDSHSNTSHEGTNNGIKHCAVPVMPQNTLENSVSTLSFNAELKFLNTKIRVSHKSTSTKLWASSPTSGFVTDLCESMLLTEWSSAKEYHLFRSGSSNWLVVHKKNAECVLPGEDLFEEDDEAAAEVEDPDVSSLGLIPKFQRVYEIKASDGFFHCTCCHSERLGMPCRHIGSLIQQTPALSTLHKNGFPLDSVSVVWRQDYYAYGMKRGDPSCIPLQVTFRQLYQHDTKGLCVPDGFILDLSDTFTPPQWVCNLRSDPVEARVLNYDTNHVLHALTRWKMRSHTLQTAPPAGFSQASLLGNDTEDPFGESFNIDQHFDETVSEQVDVDIPDSTIHTSEKYKKLYYDATEAAFSCTNRDQQEEKLFSFLNSFIAECHGMTPLSQAPSGHRISMIPANSKRQKTHGTSHY